MLLVEVLNEHVQGAFTLLGKYGCVEGGFLSVDHCKKTEGIGGRLLTTDSVMREPSNKYTQGKQGTEEKINNTYSGDTFSFTCH